MLEKQHKVVFAVSIILLAALSWVYWSTFQGLYHRWTHDDDYSYGILIPFLSAYFVWDKRRILATLPVKPVWWAIVPLAFFLGLSAYGILGSSYNAARLSIPAVVMTLVLLCFGKQYIKTLLFPLFVLFFMIPLPAIVQTSIIPPLQLISTELGSGMLRLFGISVYVEGNLIDLGTAKLSVVEACSGLRYILPLIGIGFVYSYLFEEFWWKRIANVLISIPIAILMNGVRIGATGIGVEIWGPSAAEGINHDLEAFIVFASAFTLHFLFGRSLRHLPPYPTGKFGKLETPPVVSADSSAPVSGVWKTTLASVLLTLGVGAATLNTASFPPLEVAGGMESFPKKIGDWQGRQDYVSASIVDFSGADDYFSATYANSGNEVVSLYIGYRGTPFLESDMFFHSPNVCLPGAGWKTLSNQTQSLSLNSRFPAFRVTEMISQKNDQKILTQFWFQTKSRIDPSVHLNRLQLARHALENDNTHDLFLRVITPLAEGEEVSVARVRLVRFTEEMQVTLDEFLASRERTAAGGKRREFRPSMLNVR